MPAPAAPSGPSTPQPVFRLGPDQRFALDLATRTLSEHGRPLALGARAFEVLAALAQAGGELVTKDRLLQQGWPGLVVEEANVHVQVSQLRKLLGPEAIATVPALGYRLAWAVREAAGGAARHNLPAERTPFVGRHELLQRAQRALQGTRLLSLLGIGGTGKTRLALKLAQAQLALHADGVWWLDLAPLERGEQLPHALAQALSVALQPRRDVTDQVIEAIRARQLLLVLDNCEHLVEATAEVADALLAAVGGLRIVVTSREALGLEGEVVLPVSPLTLPAADAGADAVAASEAVQLLGERAAAAAPWLSLGCGDAQALADICRRVDGIPLAIEIAAAQLRVLSPAQLLAMLGERFRLLADARRALPRQQTMQAVIQWSFEHLQPAEQELLLALALCSGGCDLAAAMALMGGGEGGDVGADQGADEGAGGASAEARAEMRRLALLASLTRLAEQSLLHVQHGHAQARYGLLETVRQYALDRLQGNPLAATLRERHVAHYLALAEAHDAEILARGEGAASLERMDLERENLLRALEACLRGHDEASLAAGLRLVGALRHYWIARALAPLGLRLGEEMLARVPPGRATDRGLLLALVSLSQTQLALGRLEAAERSARRIVAVAEALGDQAHLGGGHGHLAAILDQLGRGDEAREHHEAARRIAESTGDKRLLADALARMARVAALQARFDDAAELLARCLPLRREAGHGYRLAVTLLNSGYVASERGQWAPARDFLAEAVTWLAKVGSHELDAALLDFAARLLHHAAQWPLLVCALAAAAAHRRASGQAVDPADEALAATQLRDARAQLGAAEADAAWALGQGLSVRQARERVADWLLGDAGPAPAGLVIAPGAPTLGAGGVPV